MRTNLGILAATAMLVTLACSRTTEPEKEPEGRITLRFEQAPATSMVAGDGSKAIAADVDSLDTAIVRVFRPGTPITQEVERTVDISGGSVDVSIPCIAENGKRVSVDLYDGANFSHHGFTTGVNVVKGAQTPVSIDAYEFTVASLTVSPETATEPATFDLVWNPALAATRYRVQASSTPDFATIHWEQSATDTFLAAQVEPGAHYFRVVPETDFSNGPTSPTDFGYLQTLGGVDITGFSAPAAIPGDVVTILGENLDVPGTIAQIGSMQMTIVASSWGALDVIVPRAAVTETISVSNPSPPSGDFDTSDAPLIVQRVAYVTDGRRYADEYQSVLMDHWDDFGFSGVAVIPVEELDDRDMGVFDVVIVASDTGTDISDWGGGVPTRANAVANSAANVLAMGRGGAVFLQLVGASSAPQQTAADSDGEYYAPDGSVQIFTAPHSIGGGFIPFNSQNSPMTTSLTLASAPVGANLYASTDCDRVVVCTGPNDFWTLADFRFDNPNGTPVVYFYWGYADDPTELTSQGTDCLGNVMYMLYQNRVLTPSTPSVSVFRR